MQLIYPGPQPPGERRFTLTLSLLRLGLRLACRGQARRAAGLTWDDEVALVGEDDQYWVSVARLSDLQFDRLTSEVPVAVGLADGLGVTWGREW